MHLKVSEFHPELQHQIPALRRRTKLMRIPGVMRLVDWLRRREEGADVAELSCDTAFITSTLDGYEIRARIYKPKSINTPLPCFVYFHGGGYVMGLPEGAAEIIKQFITTRPCIVVAPDYRKAKTRPYPAGFQDCYDTLMWARDHAEDLGCRSDKLIIGGHSAGGGLSLALMQKLREHNKAQPRAAALLSPWTDLTASGLSHKERAERDPMIDMDRMPEAVDWYCPNQDKKNPLISPLFADLTGFPPLFVQVGTE